MRSTRQPAKVGSCLSRPSNLRHAAPGWHTRAAARLSTLWPDPRGTRAGTVPATGAHGWGVGKPLKLVGQVSRAPADGTRDERATRGTAVHSEAPRRPAIRASWMPWLAGLAMALAILVLSQFATRLLRHPMAPGGAWWPAAGLSLAVLARSPRRWWPHLVAAIAISGALSRALVGAPLRAEPLLRAGQRGRMRDRRPVPGHRGRTPGPAAGRRRRRHPVDLRRGARGQRRGLRGRDGLPGRPAGHGWPAPVATCSATASGW